MEPTLVLPQELVTLITTGVGLFLTWLVVEGFKGLSEAIGIDLSSLAKVIAAIVSTGIVGTLIGVLNALLGAVPVEYVPLVQAILTLIITVFGAMGIQRRAHRASLESRATNVAIASKK